MLPRSPTAQALVDLTGPILGTRFSLGGVLAESTSAILFEAEDLRTGRRTAAKLIQGPDSATGLQMLKREARAARIVHPNICSVTDFGEQGGVPYLILERLDGETLSDAIHLAGYLDFAHVKAMFIELLCALDAVHCAGLVHRDVKPSNVFLVKRDGCDPTVKLIDFGVSMRTGKKSAPLAGTPAYMAPEQARSEEIDARADIFSVGVALYHAVAGRRPYSARTYEALLAAHVSPVPDVRVHRPDAPPALSDVITRATALDRNERFASARDMQQALSRIDVATTSIWEYPTVAVRARSESCTRIAIPGTAGETQVFDETPLTQRM